MIIEDGACSVKLSVLVIGLGSIAKKHINAINSLSKKAQFFALRSSRNTVGADGVKDIYSFKDLDTKPDFVLICNPTYCHYETLDLCVDLGVPIFIEKPVLHKKGLGDDLAKRINELNINTYVGCNLRFLDSIRFIKNYIDQSSLRINEINVYCGSYLPDWRINRDFRETYSVHPELGGGVHLDLIHEIDYIRWLLGTPKEIIKTFRTKSSLDIKAFDYANYLLLYQEFAVSVVLNYYRRDSRRNCEIVLDGETILVDLLQNTVTSSRNGSLMESKQTVGDTYVEQMQYFIECIQLGRKTFNNFSDGLEVLSICL